MLDFPANLTPCFFPLYTFHFPLKPTPWQFILCSIIHMTFRLKLQCYIILVSICLLPIWWFLHFSSTSNIRLQTNFSSMWKNSLLRKLMYLIILYRPTVLPCGEVPIYYLVNSIMNFDIMWSWSKIQFWIFNIMSILINSILNLNNNI